MIHSFDLGDFFLAELSFSLQLSDQKAVIFQETTVRQFSANSRPFTPPMKPSASVPWAGTMLDLIGMAAMRLASHAAETRSQVGDFPNCVYC